MITVYAESPFVLQLAWKQEHEELCERIVNGAAGHAFELVLPMVALVEPLYVQRKNSMDRRNVAELWRKQARQLKRTNASTYQDAVAAMEDALVKAAAIEDEERASIAATISRLSAICRVLPFRESLFGEGFGIERRLDLTSVDALAIATILDDARAMTNDRAFLSLDRKSMAPAVSLLKDAGMDVCSAPASLEAWLRARGVTL